MVGHGDDLSFKYNHWPILNGLKIPVNQQRNPVNAIVGTGFPFRTPEQLPQRIKTITAILEEFADLRCLG